MGRCSRFRKLKSVDPFNTSAQHAASKCVQSVGKGNGKKKSLISVIASDPSGTGISSLDQNKQTRSSMSYTCSFSIFPTSLPQQTSYLFIANYAAASCQSARLGGGQRKAETTSSRSECVHVLQYPHHYFFTRSHCVFCFAINFLAISTEKPKPEKREGQEGERQREGHIKNKSLNGKPRDKKKNLAEKDLSTMQVQDCNFLVIQASPFADSHTTHILIYIYIYIYTCTH